MKKALLALAAIVVSAGAVAAPAQQAFSSSQLVHSQYVQTVRMDHRRKVWVPAHREHGHFVRGHYIWR